MAYFSKQNQSWTARWQINGERQSKSGFSSRRNAETYEHQQRYRHEQSLIGLEQPKDLPIAALFARYLTHAQAHKRPKSYDRDVTCLAIWEQFMTESRLVMTVQLKPELADQYKEWRSLRYTQSGRPASKRTVNLDLMTLRHVLTWAVRASLLQENPLEQIQLYKLARPDLPRYLTKEEVTQLEELAKQRNKELYQAIAVLVRTGLRSGELCGLRPSNLDLAHNLLVLHPDQTKAGRLRLVPLPEVAKHILAELAQAAAQYGRDFLFTNRAGMRQEPHNLMRRFRGLLHAAAKLGMNNTEAVNVHTLRKTYISHLIMAGEDPAKVMAIVGHEDWSTIKRYLALSKDYISKTVPLPF